LQDFFTTHYFTGKNERKMKANSKDNKDSITFTILDDSVATHGLRVLTEGVDTAQFERNPVMFYQHDDYTLPIGRWSNIRKEKGCMLADAEFDRDDPDPEVKRIIGKVDRGFIRMASVCLTDQKFSEDKKLMIPGQRLPTLISCRLREVSIVNIGANHNALKLYDEEGKEIDINEAVKLSDAMRTKKQTDNMNLDEFKKSLKLSDTATEGEVLAEIRQRLAEEATLQARVDLLEKNRKDALASEATALVDAAIREARIDASGRDVYLKFFASDHESAKAMLDAIPKREGVVRQIEQAAQGATNELSDLQKKDWDTLDREDRLLTLRDKYPDVYKEKYKQKFGVEPK
jgi:hypothetical protein